MAEERLAVVTGGERGIGRGIARRLLREGWRVVALGIDDGAAQEFIRSLGYGTDQFRYLHCDVADETAIEAAFDQLLAECGAIEGLVLNAGVASPERKPLDALSLKEWQAVLDVNLTGPLLCVKRALPGLRRGGGSVVAIASTRAAMSEPNTFAYSASKGGLLSLTHSLAVSLGPAIRVNAISPGWIHPGGDGELSPRDHQQHPVGRVGRPADIASLVAYLLGPESGFVTGQNFTVDGGMTVKMIYEED